MKDLKTVVCVYFGGVFRRTAHPVHRPSINTGNKCENASRGCDTQKKKIPTVGVGEVMQSGDICTRGGWRKINLHSFPDPKKLRNTEINYFPITDMTTRKYFASVIGCGMDERF